MSGIESLGGPVPPSPQKTVVFRTIDRGDQSNLDVSQQVVLETAAEWTTLWRRHQFDLPRPTVDFAKELVVGVFLGSRPTAGFAIEIMDVVAESSGRVVRYRETRPAAGGITAQILTSPYHLIALPRGSGDITFQRVD